jgi:LSD1 subclass zinc finger protein
MGDRAVDCARLESVCAARHQGFESPPIRSSPARSLTLNLAPNLTLLADPGIKNKSDYTSKSRRVTVCKLCRTFTMLPRGSTPRKFACG